MTAGRVLVVGLGSPDRGDDAVGPAVARIVDEWHRDTVDVSVREDPTALVQLWEGYNDVVVVDAVASGRAPGTVVRSEVGATGAPLPTGAWAAAGRGGSHAFGLAGAVELSRTLGTLPARVTVVGVEAGTFAHGGMSDAVAQRIVEAAGAVFAELAHIEARTDTPEERRAGSCV